MAVFTPLSCSLVLPCPTLLPTAGGGLPLVVAYLLGFSCPLPSSLGHQLSPIPLCPHPIRTLSPVPKVSLFHRPHRSLGP